MRLAIPSQAPSTADSPARSVPPHALLIEEVLAQFGINAEQGLGRAEVEVRRAEFYTKGAPEVILAKCDRGWRQGRIEPLT